MSEELGKLEKPAADSFREGRRLFFIPLIYRGLESPSEYLEKFDKYWRQIESHLSNLELKLGQVSKIYHELIPAGGEDGAKVIKDLNDKTYKIVKDRLDWGAQLVATEEADILTEFMDWSRCLTVGLQNQKVVLRVYEFYAEAGKKRDEYIARRIDETLSVNEIGILFMREGHKVQFPGDIQVFYIAPPALDEIKRWLREDEAKVPESQEQEKGESQ